MGVIFYKEIKMSNEFKNFEYDLTNTMRITKAKDDGFREVTQDVSTHLEWAKQMRETESARNNFSHGFKPFCNIPDSVSLELMSKYGINIHDNQTDRDALKKVKSIIKRDYPHLMYH
tara:strand:+ start:144 stop:494 length:351 start_codon:yes stop_codon:yes gene_type:complete